MDLRGCEKRLSHDIPHNVGKAVAASASRCPCAHAAPAAIIGRVPRSRCLGQNKAAARRIAEVLDNSAPTVLNGSLVQHLRNRGRGASGYETTVERFSQKSKWDILARLEWDAGTWMDAGDVVNWLELAAGTDDAVPLAVET